MAQGRTNTGSDHYVGAIVTRDGLRIIAAATYDNRIRAFGKSNGALLREGALPEAGKRRPPPAW